jgi:hypothetical protein
VVDDQFRLNCTRSQHASKRLIADHLLELDDGMREGDSRSGRTDHCRLEILEGFTSDVWTFATNRLLLDGRVRHAQTNLKPFGPL